MDDVVEVGGQPAAEAATAAGVGDDLTVPPDADVASSLFVTLVTATLLLVGTFAYQRRRPFLGVITIAPVVLVVLWTFGMMAATGIPFGPITASLAAMAIGILVTSSLIPFRQFGLVTVYAVGFALLAATLVLPSMLVLSERWHGRRALRPSEEPPPVREAAGV